MTERQTPYKARGGKGFHMASTLLQKRIRTVGEARGFAVSRLLTRWAEIVGEDVARIARPVDIRYGRGGLGATLTVLTTGAGAPLVDMSRERIRTRVNACYGHAAIARVRVTQTAATGFAEGAVAFGPAPVAAPPQPDPDLRAAAEHRTAGVGDPGLRDALAALGTHVLASGTARAAPRR